MAAVVHFASHAQDPASPAPHEPRFVHVFVALCDNDSQGIVPVPEKIGNGDDPINNLYWGCADGLKSYFKKSRDWELLPFSKEPPRIILERCIFKHANSETYLVADAYRGIEIKKATEDFLNAASGQPTPPLKVLSGSKPVQISMRGNADLVAFIGHNGLMDFDLPTVKPLGEGKRDAVVLCCRSEDYFRERLEGMRVRPLLLTRQLMYPGSFILKTAIDGWLEGESRDQIRKRAGKAYADNQKISVGAATGVFTAF